jgi:flagellar basal body-associated protein FliL
LVLKLCGKGGQSHILRGSKERRKRRKRIIIIIIIIIIRNGAKTITIITIIAIAKQ